MKLKESHHAFLLASQHPAATLSQRDVDSSMPLRMWKHGAQTYLEVLRFYLPDSSEHMLAFILQAYVMFGLLLEMVPKFTNTWLEVLGDICWYGTVLPPHTEIDNDWTKLSWDWYQKASDREPLAGRLYQRIALLLRQDSMLQLFYHIKALVVPNQRSVARESILSLLEVFVPRKKQKLLSIFEVVVARKSQNKTSLSVTKDEHLFLTAYTYLFLASQNRTFLHKEGYKRAPKAYLVKFDETLQMIEGLPKPWPTSAYKMEPR